MLGVRGTVLITGNTTGTYATGDLPPGSDTLQVPATQLVYLQPKPPSGQFQSRLRSKTQPAIACACRGRRLPNQMAAVQSPGNWFNAGPLVRLAFG